MASAWTKGMQPLTVERSATPKRVTFIYPFYCNGEFLHTTQLRIWRQEAYRSLRAYVSVIIVDDGSPESAYLPTFDHQRPFAMRLFRINVDVRWNWLAARNIGAHHAEDGWLLLTDMDHVVPAETAEAIVWGQHDPTAIYVFSRREHTGQVVSPHSASFLMTRQMFWKIGGYDEALSGHYGTDGEFRRRAMRTAPFRLLRDELIRYEYVGDSSTSRYGRKQPQDAEAQRIISARQADWHPKVLSFPYAEVTCSAS